MASITLQLQFALIVVDTGILIASQINPSNIVNHHKCTIEFVNAVYVNCAENHPFSFRESYFEQHCIFWFGFGGGFTKRNSI